MGEKRVQMVWQTALSSSAKCMTSVKSTTEARVQHLNQINPCERLSPNSCAFCQA